MHSGSDESCEKLQHKSMNNNNNIINNNNLTTNTSLSNANNTTNGKLSISGEYFRRNRK